MEASRQYYPPASTDHVPEVLLHESLQYILIQNNGLIAKEINKQMELII